MYAYHLTPSNLCIHTGYQVAYIWVGHCTFRLAGFRSISLAKIVFLSSNPVINSATKYIVTCAMYVL